MRGFREDVPDQQTDEWWDRPKFIEPCCKIGVLNHFKVTHMVSLNLVFTD